jgi:flagellar basal body-associated protein FliL
MLELLQLPTLVVALVVMSWAVIRLSSASSSSTSKEGQNSFKAPPEVLQWQADLRRLSEELQSELDEKMSAVAALSAAYEQAGTEAVECLGYGNINPGRMPRLRNDYQGKMRQ